MTLSQMTQTLKQIWVNARIVRVMAVTKTANQSARPVAALGGGLDDRQPRQMEQGRPRRNLGFMRASSDENVAA